MLLISLYDYAKSKRLLDDLPLQRRLIHALIPIAADGTLRHPYLIPLTQADESGKERPGQERTMPRFAGENNGGRAYFLAEGSVAVLGCEKESGSPVWADPAKAPKKERNAAKAFSHFWEQIQQAYDATKDSRLASLLAFSARYLLNRNGKVAADLPFLQVRPNKKGTPEFVAKTGPGEHDRVPLKAATLGFQVDGQPLTMDDDADPMRQYWFEQYAKLAFQEEPDEENGAGPTGVPSLCIVSARTGLPFARSHKPKILGIPGLTSGGYIVSFARAAPAFSSYGFEMGQNAPVSEDAAAAYALALNELLNDDETSTRLGPVAVCTWANSTPAAGRQVSLLLTKAFPEQVKAFLKAPFAGIADRDVIHKDRLCTVALSGNAGRVVVQHWIDQTLPQAAEHFRQWWEDLQVVTMYAADTTEDAKARKQADMPPSPLAIPNLARATLKRSKSQKDDRLVGDRIVQLYRAALEGTAPPLSLLKPILDEFQSALVKNDESDPKKRTYPFSLSRFSLIKLILVRNTKEGAFMPTVPLADTPDPAYNLGRLLAVFESLQDRYHDYDKKGAGIVERYYGTASSAPAAAFPILCRLARHHLSKIRKEDEQAARGIEQRITEVFTKFEGPSVGKPPVFPRLLTLEQQGRFALGFYQQKARSEAFTRVLSLLKKAREKKNDRAEATSLAEQARALASQYGYAELNETVATFNPFEDTKQD